MSHRAAIFDLDRTLVSVNTLSLYARWQFRRGKAGYRDLARTGYWLARYTFGRIDFESLTAAASLSLRGVDEAAFRAELDAWVREEVLAYISRAARLEVARRQKEGFVCAILTSSTRYSAEPLGRELGIDHVLASRLVVEDGKFTGACERPLCYGEGKVLIASEWARAHHVALEESAFFTDSISDLPMLGAVGEPVVVNPDPRLRLAARRRKWPIYSWR